MFMYYLVMATLTNPTAMTGTRALTPDEVIEISLSFYGRYAARNRTLFILGINTGFRISELLSVRIGDVWDGQQVKSYLKVKRGYMKGKSRSREMHLNEKARKAIRSWIEQIDQPAPDMPLFHGQKGGAINRQQAHNILKEVFNDCQMDGTLATHSMRKTFAESVRKASGNDIYTVSKMLGHTSIASTQHYLSITAEDQQKIIDAI